MEVILEGGCGIKKSVQHRGANPPQSHPVRRTEYVANEMAEVTRKKLEEGMGFTYSVAETQRERAGGVDGKEEEKKEPNHLFGYGSNADYPW